MANYRDKVFKLLPTLKFLDGFDLNEQEDEEEECKTEREKLFFHHIQTSNLKTYLSEY